MRAWIIFLITGIVVTAFGQPQHFKRGALAGNPDAPIITGAIFIGAALLIAGYENRLIKQAGNRMYKGFYGFMNRVLILGIWGIAMLFAAWVTVGF